MWDLEENNTAIRKLLPLKARYLHQIYDAQLHFSTHHIDSQNTNYSERGIHWKRLLTGTKMKQPQTYSKDQAATDIFHAFSGLSFKIFFEGTNTVNHVEFLTVTHSCRWAFYALKPTLSPTQPSLWIRYYCIDWQEDIGTLSENLAPLKYLLG